MSPADWQGAKGDVLERDLGAWLAGLREARGLSQEALAVQLGHEQSHVSKVEGGRRRVTVREIFTWTRVLGIEWDEVSEGLGAIWRTTGGSQGELGL
jgi:transcriptional regulator with XRE-family HTH domain